VAGSHSLTVASNEAVARRGARAAAGAHAAA
jgi:hypothetical protein